MKTLKTFAIAMLVAINLSCNSDDDSTTDGPIEASFPAQIVTSFASDTSLDTTMNIMYDSNNRIAQYRLDSGTIFNTYDIAYNQYGHIITISQLRVSDGTSLNYLYNFSYTDGIVSQITRIFNENVQTFNVVYDTSIERYQIQIGSFSANYYTFDDLNNLTAFNNGSGTVQMNYNGLEGVFPTANTNLALHFSLIFSNIANSTIATAYFSNKELVSLQRASGYSQNVTTTRNTANAIEQMVYTDASTSELYATSTITY